MSLRSWARLRMLSLSGPSKIPGKIVKTSKRTPAVRFSSFEQCQHCSGKTLQTRHREVRATITRSIAGPVEPNRPHPGRAGSLYVETKRVTDVDRPPGRNAERRHGMPVDLRARLVIAGTCRADDRVKVRVQAEGRQRPFEERLVDGIRD